MQNKLQTGVNLKKKKWKGSHKCVVCGEPETEDHIFFSCITARFTWACIREALGWERSPTGITDYLNNWARWGGGKTSLDIFCLAIVSWGLWVTRNKCAIEGCFPTRPIEILYRINFCLQKWQVMLKEGDRVTVEEKIKTIQEWAKGFLKECSSRPTVECFM